MEEDDLPETVSPVGLPDAIAPAATPDNHYIAAESASVKISVKAGQKRKQKDSNTNQLPRSDEMLSVAWKYVLLVMLHRPYHNQQHLCFLGERLTRLA